MRRSPTSISSTNSTLKAIPFLSPRAAHTRPSARLRVDRQVQGQVRHQAECPTRRDLRQSKKLGSLIPQEANSRPRPRTFFRTRDDLTPTRRSSSNGRSKSMRPTLPTPTMRSAASCRPSKTSATRSHADHLHQRHNDGSAEGSPSGTPNEMTFFNGSRCRVADPMKFYDVSARNSPIPTWQSVGPRRSARPTNETSQTPRFFDSHPNGIAIAFRQVTSPTRRHPQSVSPRDQYVPTILEVTGVHAPAGRRYSPKHDQGGEPRLHLDKANATAPSTQRPSVLRDVGDRALYQDGSIASTVPYRNPGTAPPPYRKTW